MSLHFYNFLTLKRIAKASADKNADAQLIDFGDIVNDAVMQVATYRKWSWRIQSMSAIVTGGQSSVALPVDFAGLDSIAFAASTCGLIIPSTIDAITQMRMQSGEVTSSVFYYAIGWAAQASATDIPVARLEVYPTPADDVAFSGYYTRAIAKLVADTAVPDMPPQFQQAVRMAIRANAKRETNQKGWDVDQTMLDSTLTRLAREDGLLQGNLGRMRGAVNDAASQTIVRVDPVITWPNA